VPPAPRLGPRESTALAVKREDGGKIRIASQLWETPKVILKGEVLEIRKCRRAAAHRPKASFAR
jgi:hypothetical protein